MIQVTINLRAVLIGFVLLLVAGGIATPFAISLAADGPTGDRVSEQRLAGPLGTAFTYQGRLDTGIGSANGQYEFEFRLFDALSRGTQVVTNPVFVGATRSVTNGLFSAELDFGNGVGVFDGNARWLEVKAKIAGGALFDTLAPRQELKPVPYALHVPWSGVSGKPVGFADGSDNDVLGGLSCANGQVAKLIGSSWSCAADNDTTYTAVPNGGLTLIANAFNADPAGQLPGRVEHSSDRRDRSRGVRNGRCGQRLVAHGERGHDRREFPRHDRQHRS